MERTSVVRDLSQIEAQISKLNPAPREGQSEALLEIAKCPNRMNVKLPTGYGKTYLALAAYSILKSIGEVNRLLVIVPTVAQRTQFEQSTPRNWGNYAIDGPSSVCDVSFFDVEAIRKHQKDDCQVYAITVQSLIGPAGQNIVSALLQKGRWMVVVDEYHHYGIKKRWGTTVASLNHDFLLCMSATPTRPDEDSAFGKPDVSVTYRQAVKDKAVKPLLGHAYHYKIDAVANGEVVSYSTTQIAEEAGGDSPKKIQKFLIDRKVRWSPKYISPLVTNPIDRMLAERLKTGKKLQAVVGAMCVSHAQLVYDQICSTFPCLNVEWVGTGDDGRPSEENEKIINQFAPSDGSDPTVDVLVHVGMAGEGLDTVMVSEVIHLNSASINNSNNQENGRAARYLEGVVGHINFDGSSEYCTKDYVGPAIMDAMDDNEPGICNRCEKKPCECDISREDNFLDIPEQPVVELYNVELLGIDSGDATVQKMAGLLCESVKEFTRGDLDDPDSEVWKYAIDGVTRMREREADEHNEKSEINQLKDRVGEALTIATSNVIRCTKANGLRVDRSFYADVKRRINSRKKLEIGEISKSKEVYSQHYQWLHRFNKQLEQDGGVPEWCL